LQMKRNEVVYSILEEYSEMNNAFEYELLETKLEFMLPESPTLADLQTLMTRFSDTHKDVLTTSGGVPNEASVYYTFKESDEPKIFEALKETGVGYFSIPPPGQSKYRDLRVSGFDVQAYVYPSNDNATQTASVEISKGGYSTFYPIGTMDKPVTYLHTDVTDNRIYPFIYNPQTCTGISQPCTSRKCTDNDFISVSPYGEWKVKLADSNMLDLMQNATEVRMAFKVAYHTSSDGQEANYTDTMFGNDKCTSAPVCFVQDGVDLISEKECALPEPEPEPEPEVKVELEASTVGMSGGGKAALAVGLIVLLAVASVMVYKKVKSDDDGLGSRQSRGSRYHVKTEYANPQYSTSNVEHVVEVWKSKNTGGNDEDADEEPTSAQNDTETYDGFDGDIDL